MWPCLCGLWIVAETMLATVRCAHDETKSRFVCPAEVSPHGENVKKRGRKLTIKQTSRWVTITTVGVCLEVCLVVLWNMLVWRLKKGWTDRLVSCATSSSRLL
jgi:hypothetical protein